MNLIDRISHQFEDNMRASLEALEFLAAPIAGAVELITASLLDSGKVLVCGSSGSAGDARRFAAQLVNGFELERPALAAMALSADSSSLAPVAGDPDTQALFARQIAAFGQPGDILLTLSANPDSARVLDAIRSAHERDMRVIALTGAGGGRTADVVMRVDNGLDDCFAAPAVFLAPCLDGVAQVAEERVGADPGGDQIDHGHRAVGAVEIGVHAAGNLCRKPFVGSNLAKCPIGIDLNLRYQIF